jgi:hypothetical protein
MLRIADTSDGESLAVNPRHFQPSSGRVKVEKSKCLMGKREVEVARSDY